MKTLVAAFLTLSAATAAACTVCESPDGVALRAEIFNDDLPLTLLKVTAAFPVLGLVLYAVDRFLPE